MKILYFTQTSKAKNTYSSSDIEYDFESIADTIVCAIRDNVPGAEVSFGYEVCYNVDELPEIIKGFDLCLCDLTTHNGNYTYLAGLSEGLGKPVIYFCTSDHPPTYILSGKNILQYSQASLEHEFKVELIKLVKKFIEDPSAFKAEGNFHQKTKKAFISYSHKDREYMDRLMVHLRPLERKGIIGVWQDTQIKIGDKWQEKINTALNEASIAILLISADFMASDFIVDNELPPILSKAEVNGTKVIPVILSPCRFAREPSLNRFQAANLPSEPLSVISQEKREAIYDKLASEIEAALSNA